MKSALLFLLIISATLVTAQTAASADKHASDMQTILQLRDALLKAYDVGDVKTLDQIEEDDFTLANDKGQLSKQQHLDFVRHREKPQQVTRKIDNEFRFYGDVVLLTEVDHATSPEGKSDFQTTTIWVRPGNAWRIAHMHFSLLVN